MASVRRCAAPPIGSTRERTIARFVETLPTMTQVTSNPGDDNFAALFEQSYEDAPEIREGTIVRGTIVDVIGDYAVVDVGLKAEGRVPLREFREEDDEEGAEPQVKVGDIVEVLLETAEDQNGLVIL